MSQLSISIMVKSETGETKRYPVTSEMFSEAMICGKPVVVCTIPAGGTVILETIDEDATFTMGVGFAGERETG